MPNKKWFFLKIQNPGSEIKVFGALHDFQLFDPEI